MRFVDSDHPAVVAFGTRATAGTITERDRAVRLFYAVRDGLRYGLRYDPYAVSTDPEDYRAGAIAQATAGWCVPKAVLLCATARACGIEALLGFADVRNHLQSDKLRQQMSTDVFVYHGYVALHGDGRWVKVTPAFNIELCERFGARQLEFDGTDDALLHPAAADGRRHMEYLRDRGLYDDLPVDEIMAALRAAYPALLLPPVMATEAPATTGSGPRRSRQLHEEGTDVGPCRCGTSSTAVASGYDARTSTRKSLNSTVRRRASGRC